MKDCCKQTLEKFVKDMDKVNGWEYKRQRILVMNDYELIDH